MDHPLLQALERLVEQRTGVIVSQLVQKYRSGALTPQDALSGIAAVAALRSLRGDAEADLKSQK